MKSTKNIKSLANTPASRVWLYFALAALLVACFWIGWRDFDPNVAQEVVRENIRSTIRRTIQIVIEYIIPLSILVFFVREIIARKRSKQ